VREMKNRNSRMREIAFQRISHTVLYGFYGFDLTNNAKKKYTSENDPLQAQITMREFQFFESIIEKHFYLRFEYKTIRI
jgi:hypothetical protein